MAQSVRTLVLQYANAEGRGFDTHCIPPTTGFGWPPGVLRLTYKLRPTIRQFKYLYTHLTIWRATARFKSTFNQCSYDSPSAGDSEQARGTELSGTE